MAEDTVSVAALIEMLKRELEASKSVNDHLSFLRQLAADPTVSAPLRDHLVNHIGEEEAEHQAHLARLLPALEGFERSLSGGTAPSAPPPGAAESGFTVGSLVDKRPWHIG